MRKYIEPPKIIAKFLRQDCRSFLYCKYNQQDKLLFGIDSITDTKKLNPGMIFYLDGKYYKIIEKLIQFVSEKEYTFLRPILNVYVKEIEYIPGDNAIESAKNIEDIDLGKEDINGPIRSKHTTSTKKKNNEKEKPKEKTNKKQSKNSQKVLKKKYTRRVKCKTCGKMYLNSHTCADGNKIERWSV